MTPHKRLADLGNGDAEMKRSAGVANYSTNWRVNFEVLKHTEGLNLPSRQVRRSHMRIASRTLATELCKQARFAAHQDMLSRRRKRLAAAAK